MEHTNPWLSIWTQPRATIARIIAENPNRSLWLLAAIYGFCSLVNMFQSLAVGSALGMTGALILAIIIAPFYGYISFYIWSWFVTWTGKWFKGEGTFKTVRASYAWSCVPIAVNIPLWILMFIIFGSQVFQNYPEAPLLPSGQVFVLFAMLIAKVVLAIWSLIIFINALAEVQKYSVIRAILNILAAGIILGIIFFALWSALIYAFSGVTASAFMFLKTI